jgi:hypothetical protein
LPCGGSERDVSENRGGAPADERGDSAELCVDLLAAEIRRAGPDDDHDVDPRREEARVLSKDLTEEALRAVSLDGAADLSRGDDAEARGAVVLLSCCRRCIRSASGEQDQEMTRAYPRAALPILDADEVGALADALGSGERRATVSDDSATSCR